jgi:hypothetical protein
VTERCSRCEAEFKESELIIRMRQKSNKEDYFCGYCFLATEVLRFTRGPIQRREDMAVHPVRVYSRALAKVVKKRNGKENELQGSYDRLITESVREHAPDWMQEHLGEAEKAVQGRLPAFDKRGDQAECSQQALEDAGNRGESK